MAGRYRGSTPLPQHQKVPWYAQAGRWLARRGYDLINASVPGTVFDYREGTGDINPGRAFRNSTVAEVARYARGRPEGMSDEEWERIRREGREGVFDTAWDLLPIPRVPVVSSAIRRGSRNLLLGPASGQNPARPTGSSSTVVPTVSGSGVTTTEAPVTVRKPAKPSKPSMVAPTPANVPLGLNRGGTRGFGAQVADDNIGILDQLGFGSGFAGIGYRGVTGELTPYSGLDLERQDIYNTSTGRQVNVQNQGAEDTGQRVRFRSARF